MNLPIFGNALWATATLGLISTGAAFANTVTFDNLPDYYQALGSGAPPDRYVENGVTVTATTPDAVIASFFSQGAANIVDSGSDLATGLVFSMERPFDALGFSLISLGYEFINTPRELADNIFVSGFSAGNLVASASYKLSDLFLDVQNIVLGSAFTALDALVIELTYPKTDRPCGAPCGQFDLDWVELSSTAPAPVPVPPAAPLLASAAFALFALRRRKA